MGLLAGSLLLGALAGCRPAAEGVCIEGSDTMVNLAQGWAENYHATYPEAMIQISGGGSGVGIASLIDGNCEIASASRKMKDKEIERVKRKRHQEPKEIIVGYDALAVYVHKDNPLDSISIEELAEIYGEGGKITRWSQLGVDPKRLGQRYDHPRQPAEQFGHLRLFPRGGDGQDARLQARLDRPERLGGRRGPGGQHAQRHRL